MLKLYNNIASRIYTYNYIYIYIYIYTIIFSSREELRRLALYFTSSYVTFSLFIGFLAVVILAALNILKNNLLIIIVSFY